MSRRGYGDTMPDTPNNYVNRDPISGFGTGRAGLRSIAPTTAEQRAAARRYLERVAPDLVDVLGLA